MQLTPNLNMKKPEGSDVVDIAELNENADILDAEVTKLASTSAAGRMSAADKAKLDGIAAGANAYVHPTGDGNLHVPATGTGNNGRVLKAGATAGSAAWGNVAFSELSGTTGAANDTVIGNRTVDQATVTAFSNTGALTQILSWIVKMLKAIVGSTNWYDTPPATLTSLNTAITNHTAATTGIHGATSAATASRLVLRDANGRAQFENPSATQDVATKGYVDTAGNGKVSKSGDWMTGLLTSKESTGSMTSLDIPQAFEVRSATSSADAAYMSFHRPGYFGAHLGVDTDNKLKFGGWSVGEVHEIFHAGNKPYVSGTYTGNGEASRDIQLPFTPSVVLIVTNTGRMDTAFSPNGNYGGLALSGSPSVYGSTGNVILIGTSKFTVYEHSSIHSNSSGVVYNYIAFR